MKSRLFEVKARAWVITFAILITYHLSLITSPAQTFTQQVQQHRSGEGTVTIHHDADIDRLVNAASTAHKPTAIPTKSTATPKPSATPKSAASSASSTKAATPTAPTKATSKPKAEKPKAEKPKAEKPKAEKPKAEKPKAEKPKAEKPKAEKPKAEKTNTEKSKKPQEDTTKTKPLTDTTRTTPREDSIPAYGDTIAIPTAPRHGYKTTGYRVQAFAGGNTRRDRQKAEQTGNALRQLFPGEDVYVRFYSPRWVCRIGNYRTYEEAHEKMLEIRKIGYESATIVKGKIIVYVTP